MGAAALRGGAQPRSGLRDAVGLGHLGAHVVQGAADEPRDVHLGDADLLGDLALGQAVEEAQAA
jgi:hypothetical protein